MVMKYLGTLAAGLAMCGAALSQEVLPAPATHSPLNAQKCPVVMRLGLTKEQSAKIAKLEAEYDKRITDVGVCQGDQAPKKRQEVRDEFRSAMVDLLDAAQKTKYEAGMALLKEYAPRIEQAGKAVSAAGADSVSRAEAEKGLASVIAERNKALDEKVGALPAEGKGCCKSAKCTKRADSKPAKCCAGAATNK